MVSGEQAIFFFIFFFFRFSLRSGGAHEGFPVLAFIIRDMRFSDGHLLLAICNHLTLLCELLDGMYVGLLGHLPLCFLNVVEVKRWSGRGKARGRLVSNGGQRGKGGHGSQGTHVGQGSRHSSRGHACHSCTHGHVGHTGDSWDIGQTHRTHVGHVGHPHSHRQGERQRQGERGGGRGRQRELQDGFRPQALGNGHPGLRAHGGRVGFGDLQ